MSDWRQDDREKVPIAGLLRRASEFDAAFDAIVNGVFVYNAAGLLIRANRTAVEVYGVEPGRTHWRDKLEMLHMSHPNGRPVSPPDLPIGRALHGETVRNMPMTITTRSGERRSVFATATPVYQEGRLVGGVAVWNDVTESEQAHEALRAANEALEQRVQERTVELLEQMVGRRHVEASLHESEERFRTAMETMPDLVGIYSAIRDAQGRIVDLRIEYVNPTLSGLNHYSQEEQIGQTLFILLPAHAGAGLFEAYCRVIETGEPLILDSLEYEDAPPGKEPITLVLDLRVTRLGDGILVTGRDVTARVQAEAALREREAQLQASEARYRSVVEDQTEMIARFRADGTISFVNSAWSRFFGPSDEYDSGGSVWPIVFEEDQRWVAEKIASLTPDDPIESHENRVVMLGGEIRWTQWVNRAFFDAEGRLVEWQAVGRDITEQRLVDEALRQSEQMIRRQAERDQAFADLGRAVAEVSFDSQAVADTATRRVVDILADAATVQLLSDDSQTLNPISFYHRDPEAAALFKRLLQIPLRLGRSLGGQVAATGKSLRLSMPTSDEVRALIQPEHVEYLERVGLYSVMAVPLCVHGRVIGALTASRDHPDDPFTAEDEAFVQQVADRVALAVQNAALFRDVKQALAEREQAEADVRRLNEELEERVQERTAELESFAYSVSHDLRSPLRAINGFSQMLLNDCAAALDEESRRRLDVIRANALKMSDLIDGILALSRLGRAELRPVPVDMAALARDAFAEVQQVCPQDEIEIEIDLRPLPEAYGDRGLLRQVMVNLLSNAVKFSRPKGEIRLEVGGRSENSETVYYVRDRGVGFDMQYVHKLFGVFQRLHADAAFEGTGIGLALVQRVVRRHGGRVWADGCVGDGATFYFSLPHAARIDMDQVN